MYTKVEGLTFQPWIPESYYDANNPYGKLLILGESHYIGDIDIIKVDYSEFTSEIIEGVINGEYDDLRYYRNFGKIFNDDAREIWNSVAFANLIQAGLIDADSQPTKEQFQTITPALWLLIENLKPQKIIVTSMRMWNHWFPDNDSRCNYVTSIKANGKESSVWRYQHEDGYSYAMATKHPSRYFPHKTHKPLIEKFLSTDFSV